MWWSHLYVTSSLNDQTSPKYHLSLRSHFSHSLIFGIRNTKCRSGLLSMSSFFFLSKPDCTSSHLTLPVSFLYCLQVGFFPSECVELINDKVPQSMTNTVPKPGTPPLPLKPFTGNVLEGSYHWWHLMSHWYGCVFRMWLGLWWTIWLGISVCVCVGVWVCVWHLAQYIKRTAL